MKASSVVGLAVCGAMISSAFAKPAENRKAPAENKKAPAEDKKAPAENKKAPAENKEAPAADKAPADPQFIAADDWFFVATADEGKGTIYLGKKRDLPEENGQSSFITTAQNSIIEARVFFQTRMAKPADLFAGRLVIYPRNKKIESADDKYWATVWNYRRIVNVVDAPKGKVMVAGVTNSVVDIDTIRVPVGDATEAPIKLTGKEDAHYFHPEHWLVYDDDDPPEPDGHDTRMALVIKPPAKPGEEGTFLLITNGRIIKTKHAYRTRAATKADLKAGLRLAIYSGLTSDGPKRDDAYQGLWSVGNLTSYDNNIPKLGNHTVRIDGMRVILP